MKDRTLKMSTPWYVDTVTSSHNNYSTEPDKTSVQPRMHNPIKSSLFNSVCLTCFRFTFLVTWSCTGFGMLWFWEGNVVYT